MAEETPNFRPLYFLAGYPHSGGEFVRAVTYAAAALSAPQRPEKLDFRNIDNIIPWDVHENLYQMALGKDPKTLSEQEIAAGRLAVHRLIAEKFPGLPLVKTQAMRATYHGNATINGEVSRGATYVVRNPIDLAVVISRGNRIDPVKAIGLMVQPARRVKPHTRAVLEPQGSWLQNVDSWTAGTDRNIHVARYEDLVKSPSKAFEAIFRHMMLSVTGGTIDQSLKAVKAVHGEMKAHAHTELRPLEVRAIIEINATGMDRHGYLTDEVLAYANIGREEALVSSRKYAQQAIPTQQVAPQAAND